MSRTPRRKGTGAKLPAAAGDGASEPTGAVLVRWFAVDRREGSMVVMVDDAGTPVDVTAERLPRGARAEGAVLRVPVGRDGVARWEEAVRDREEENRRRAEISRRVRRLEGTDRGGDIEL
jgi:hypothetical protein